MFEGGDNECVLACFCGQAGGDVVVRQTTRFGDEEAEVAFFIGLIA